LVGNCVNVSILFTNTCILYQTLQRNLTVISMFSNVLLRLKPRGFDFATSSLSKYKTTFPLVPIAFASEGMRGKNKVISLVIVFLIIKT
jgi:hypothetical protein